MLWYNGPTFLEALHNAVTSHQPPERPLRIPLREVLQIGGTGVVAVGCVETGTLRPGMKLVFVPSYTIAQVRSIEMHHEVIEEATRGNSVGFCVDVAMKELRRGMVGSAADDSPARECSSFLAQVIVLCLPRPGREGGGEIRAGLVLTVDCHTAQVPCVFEELLSRTDRRTGKTLDMQPNALRVGHAAVVRLRPQAPMCVEPFAEYPPLGRFAVRDQKATVAVGVVQEVEHAPVPSWSPTAKATVKPSAPRMKSTKAHHAAKPKVAVASTSCDGGYPKPTTSGSPSSFAGGSPFAMFGATAMPKRRAKETRAAAAVAGLAAVASSGCSRSAGAGEGSGEGPGADSD